jgi:hypothetical protein
MFFTDAICTTDEWSPSTSLCSVFWVNLQVTIIRVNVAGITIVFIMSD